MADQAAAQVAVIAPPTQNMSAFAFAVQVGDLMMTVGQNRVSIVLDPNGIPTPQPAVEFFLTLSMSPQIAIQMQESLKTILDIYESQFGKIPLDPKHKITVNAPKA